MIQAGFKRAARRAMTATMAMRDDQLYAEAIRLGDAARRHFDAGQEGARARAALPPLERARVAAESLAVTARLLEIVSWFLRRQAAAAGDGPVASGPPPALIGEPHPPPVPEAMLPPGRAIAHGSRRLYRAVQALDREGRG